MSLPGRRELLYRKVISQSTLLWKERITLQKSNQSVNTAMEGENNYRKVINQSVNTAMEGSILLLDNSTLLADCSCWKETDCFCWEETDCFCWEETAPKCKISVSEKVK